MRFKRPRSVATCGRLLHVFDHVFGNLPIPVWQDTQSAVYVFDLQITFVGFRSVPCQHIVIANATSSMSSKNL